MFAYSGLAGLTFEGLMSGAMQITRSIARPRGRKSDAPSHGLLKRGAKTCQ